MSIAKDLLSVAERVAEQIDLPRVSRIYLPQQQREVGFRDEFGLIFLEDGTAAPFYASLPGTLSALWQQHASIGQGKYDLLELIHAYPSQDPSSKALALGAYNALGQWVMRHAGLLPHTPVASKLGSIQPQAGEQIGMVGYFCPVIDTLRAQGLDVLVIEQQPERVPSRPGVRLSENPADLADCRIVLCTATTLVNDSIDDILRHCQGVARFSLIGPSGSGLPDALFARGVDAVGGVYFPDSTVLTAQLDEQQSWGKAGLKYELTPAAYCGYQALLDRIKKPRHGS